MQTWLINYCCNPNKSMIGQHIEILSKSMNLHSSTYEKFIFLGNFDTGMEHLALTVLCNLYSFTRLINKPYWKNPSNSTYIDFIFTNHPIHFQNSHTIETDLSYFHKMVVTVMKTDIWKLKSKTINVRQNKTFPTIHSRAFF